MKLPIYQVDSFTGKLFGGNPAAVVLLEEWMPDETMQAIGLENNLSETAFAVPKGDVYELRWFTPEVEVDLCGHATLATAYVLFQEGRVKEDKVSFETRSGIVSVTKEGDLLSMDFPSRPPSPVPVTDELVEALGSRPNDALASRDLMAVFENRSEISSLKPRFDLLGKLDAFAVMVTAPGDEVDFVSRFFAPKAGIDEDPATGSSFCTLVPYWARRLGKSKLHALQLSRRVGEFYLEDRGDRVTISGHAVLYMTGEIGV